MKLKKFADLIQAIQPEPDKAQDKQPVIRCAPHKPDPLTDARVPRRGRGYQGN